LPTVFNKIVEGDNLYRAYEKAMRGGNRYTSEAMEFEADDIYNLTRLRACLADETYEFQGYSRFIVHEPKERIIDAPHFVDKVVQLAINFILKDLYQPCFIYDSYASLDEKGTHVCVDRLSYFSRKGKWQYGDEAYIIKLDVEKFFYSIDRTKLKQILAKKITCDKTLRLIYKIIDSAEVISDRGLPLGNTLSQLFANIYMNELDQYCKRKLGLKYYVRYMDDVIIFVENKTTAIKTKNLVETFTRDELNLNLNQKKSKIFPVAQGVNAIGFKIYPTHRLLRNDSKKKIKRKARKIRPLIEVGALPIERADQIFGSWSGHAQHCNSYNFVKKLVDKHDYLQMVDRKGSYILKINQARVLERKQA